MKENNGSIENSPELVQRNSEELQRDLERRKLLVVFCCLAWNMMFFAFFLLPLVKIYKFGNPHWLALANALFSLFIAYLLWKRQKSCVQKTTESLENDEPEEIA